MTNAQWAEAVKADAVREPNAVGNSFKWYKDPAMADAPVVGVTWFMARDFAAWLGTWLPTEREWEFAVRGVENWEYPWGGTWDEDKAVWEKNSGGKPAPVWSKPKGKSWVGAYHLSGNVGEWTGSLYEHYPYVADGSRERDILDGINVPRVQRGGSWGLDDADDFRATYRDWVDPSTRNIYTGFRVVRFL